MVLSNDLITQFAKIVQPDVEQKETLLYGTIIKKDESQYYVKIDGSDLLTPLVKTTDIKGDDRVTVSIKNHTALVTGNLTSPSARTHDVANKDEFNDASAKITAIEADIKNLQTTKLDAEYANIINGSITNLDSKYAKIENLNAQTARIDDLVSDNVTINNKLTAAEADIETLEADYADIKNRLVANEAVITTLNSTYATIDNLNATNATINNLSSTYAKITDLNAAKGDISDLKSNVADIDTLMFGSASGDTIQTSFSNSVIAQLGNAQIKSAMIESVSADKITAGDIITNNVRVLSEDGRLLISDETLQISDNTRVRVQIGKDAANDYSINVWDQNGNLMFSKGGITDSAIKEAIIRNDMVSDTANIAAHKLDIDSLFEEINGSSKTIKSSKVLLDEENQTLDVAFTSLITDVEGLSDDVSSQGTQISAIQGQISSKVWQEDITTAISDIEVGGRNLLLDSAEGYATPNSDYTDMSSFDETEGIITTLATGKANRYAWISTKYATPLSDIVSDTGEYYTFSMDVKLSGSFAEFLAWIDIRSNSAGYSRPLYIRIHPDDIIYDKWIRISGTTTIAEMDLDDYTRSIFGFGWNDSEVGSTIEWRYLKLEKGNTATDWSPAPEDVESNVTNLTTQYSSLEQTVDSISATVATHTTTLESKADNTTVTAVSEKVTTLEQNLDGFKTTVSDTYATQTELATTNAKAVNAQSSADAAQSDIDNLEIGARNYFVRKNINNFAWGSSSEEHPNGMVMESPKYRGFSFQVVEGEQWTLYRTDVTNNRWGVYWLAEEPALNVDFLSGGAFRRDDQAVNTVNYLTVPTGATWGFIYLSNDVSTGDIPNIMLEKGNRATDWSPAPEDVDADISNALDAANDAQSDVDALESRVTIAETSISQNSEAIELRATKTEVATAKSEAISSAVETASSDATTKANNALESANQNTSNLLTNYSTTSQMESAIDVSAKEIKSSVSETYTTKEEFNNLEIGGRNYFRSSLCVDLGCTGVSSSEQVLISTGACVGFYISVTAGDVWSISKSSVDITNRFDYCFTIDEPASGVVIYNWNTGYRNKTKIEGITVPEGYNYLFIYLSNQNDDVSTIKLERGDKCTDWTPSPEDMATSERMTSAESSINQLSNKIGSTVNESNPLGTRMSIVEQTASELTVRLDNQTIGGTNILRGTNTVSTLGSSASWANSTWRIAGGGSGARTVIDISDAPNGDIKKGFQIVGQSDDAVIAQDSIPVTEGVEYTLSCYAKGSGNLVIRIGKSTYDTGYHSLSDQTTWKRYSFNAVIGLGESGDGNGITNGTTNVYFGNNGTGTMQICGLKMELGNVATDWTPSPYDFDSGIDAASKTATNYLGFSSSGLIVGDMTASTLGNNVLIDSDSVDIRNGDTTLASFGADYLYLAKNSRNATIDMCNGLATMYHASKYSYDSLFVIDTAVVEIIGKGTPLCLTSTGTLENVSIQFANASKVLGGIGIIGSYLRRYGSNMFDTYTILDKGNFHDVMDEGWVHCSYGDGFTRYSNNHANIQVRKVGKQVYLRGEAKPTTAVTPEDDASTVLAVIPEGYRPSYRKQFVMQGSAAYRWLLSVHTNGNLCISRYTNDTTMNKPISAGAWLCCHAQWIID